MLKAGYACTFHNLGSLYLFTQVFMVSFGTLPVAGRLQKQQQPHRPMSLLRTALMRPRLRVCRCNAVAGATQAPPPACESPLPPAVGPRLQCMRMHEIPVRKMMNVTHMFSRPLKTAKSRSPPAVSLHLHANGCACQARNTEWNIRPLCSSHRSMNSSCCFCCFCKGKLLREGSLLLQEHR